MSVRPGRVIRAVLVLPQRIEGSEHLSNFPSVLEVVQGQVKMKTWLSGPVWGRYLAYHTLCCCG